MIRGTREQGDEGAAKTRPSHFAVGSQPLNFISGSLDFEVGGIEGDVVDDLVCDEVPVEEACAAVLCFFRPLQIVVSGQGHSVLGFEVAEAFLHSVLDLVLVGGASDVACGPFNAVHGVNGVEMPASFGIEVQEDLHVGAVL